MSFWKPLLVAALLSSPVLTIPSYAQEPPIVPQSHVVLSSEHFSYDALRQLVRAGSVEGYPAEEDPFKGRLLTRLEMASLIVRLISRAERLLKTHDPAVTFKRENLLLANRLIQEFRVELAQLGVDLKELAKRIPQFAAHSSEPIAPAIVKEAQVEIAKQGLVVVGREGDEIHSELERLKSRISGYFQFRYDQLTGDKDLFRNGGGGGTGQRPSIGGPAVGGASSGFVVRRGRVRIGERVTKRDEYVFQLDFPTNSAVNVRDAFIRLRDFPAKNLSFRAGQFAFAYGFEYLYSSRYRETPERALGFSDSTQATFNFKSSVAAPGGEVTPGSVLPFFFDQDRDIGVEIAWADEKNRGFVPRAAISLIQGEGRSGSGQRALNNSYDIVASVEALEVNRPNRLSGGLSLYRGVLPVRSAAPASNTPAPFTGARREFGGIYLRYQTRNEAEYRAEYSGGLYEVTPDRALKLPGNKFRAWYVVTRQPLAKNWEGFLKYDEFAPVRDGRTVAGVPGNDLTRKTLSFGVLYQFTAATRFRALYNQGLTPYDPSRPSGDILRKKVGLLQVEVQVTY